MEERNSHRRPTSPAIWLFTLGIVATTACGAAGQTVVPSVEFGKLRIALGLPADKTVAALQQDYAIHSDESAPLHKWVVSKKKDTFPIGVVYANGNSVVGIQYMLQERETNSTQDVFDALFGVASKLSSEGRNTCAVTNWSGYVPSASLNKAGVSFDCGAYHVELKRIQITTDGQTTTGYMVWESLGATD
jgi:hypothetical protein